MSKTDQNLNSMDKEALISALKQKARESWGGKIGEGRAEEIETFLRKMLKNYSQVLGFSEEEMLQKLESVRGYSAINYYQECNLPSLEDVAVFETIKALNERFPSKQFVCPRCGGISINPSTCNSGKEMEKGKVCDWKAWGLFKTMGNGYQFVVRDDFLNNPVVHEIFMPVELKDKEYLDKVKKSIPQGQASSL